MKFSKLLSLTALSILSTTIIVGCERQLLSPVNSTDPAQTALSNLADTAAEWKFVKLANAASDVAEVLAIEDGTTSVQPLFTKLYRLADEADFLHHVLAGCEIDLGELAAVSAMAVEAYTKRINAVDMEQALQNLAPAAETAKMALQQLPADNTFIPFIFGYGHTRQVRDYQHGVIVLHYDTTIRQADKTKADVIALLEHKGYTVTPSHLPISAGDAIELNAPVDPLLLLDELIVVPGIARGHPWYYPTPTPTHEAIPPPPSYYILRRMTKRYNTAWCQGKFDAIDSILIEESGLDFFDYAFVRNLANIYVEEIPETAERVRTNKLFHRSMAREFLDIYFQHSEKTLDEILELFRQSVRTGNVSLELIHYH